MLIDRDIDALVAGDWELVRDDFDPDKFVGYDCGFDPIRWRIALSHSTNTRNAGASLLRSFAALIDRCFGPSYVRVSGSNQSISTATIASPGRCSMVR